MDANHLDRSGFDRWLSVGLVCLAVTLRLLIWPGLHELRDGDELGYSWGSLQLLEGNLPGIHYAPAGPQTWAGWFYEGLVTVKNLAFPDSVERKAPRELRPFLAVNHTVFDAYRDAGWLRQVWILSSFLCAIGGVFAACKLGLRRAGIPGAIYLGGSVALLPLFVEYSVQARPYIAGWGLGLMALSLVFASSRQRNLVFAGIFMGLSIGSRVDMAMLLPFVWSELWHGEDATIRWRKLVQFHAVVALSFIVAAPWYLMTLVASLRAVATIRGAGGLPVAKPITVFLQVLWDQGLLFQALLFLPGLLLLILSRPRRWILALYLFLVSVSIFKGAAFGLRYQGAPLILVIVASLTAVEWLRRYSRRFAFVASVVALILPAMQSIRLIVATRENYVPDLATEWMESQIPAGTIVYVRPWITNLLPTVDASDGAWAEVTDNSAFERKFRSGLERFHLPELEVPRALSEVNLALERANRRGYFILGSRQWIDAPRYDTRVFESGPVFGVRNLPSAYRATGGTVILRSPHSDPLVEQLGTPVVTWLNKSGEGTRIFCSPDLMSKIKRRPMTTDGH